ncbi:septal ring lytic transglycosylase RlpA family protein [Erythrobacter litoralis]|uniref:Endolytic peptidoglycan transglycosylase RlpA n=1 Tax=Erythrobacter litoralis (strain HTCC2594) TaxID=314225 RepID=Q2N9H8_ERYLH|nr:septal ring lytic transglycosylase RlpA family protein [Erythrobacter litoralis]ABC63663.1 hypothetical protein ELI_07855 [Erythrobacter litoralis HTCC2594]
MFGRGSKTIWRGFSAAAFALTLALPAQASTPAVLSDGISDAEFERSFERFDDLPDLPEATGNVVDIAAFDPPVEVEEEPAARSLGMGVASYYGRKFHGRRTANGERFDMNGMTAAHKTLPFGTKVRVTNASNGRSVVVRINDRGPFVRGRTIDLSRKAAGDLGIISRGHGRVEIEILD